jgi:hypothetical protein
MPQKTITDPTFHEFIMRNIFCIIRVLFYLLIYFVILINYNFLVSYIVLLLGNITAVKESCREKGSLQLSFKKHVPTHLL